MPPEAATHSNSYWDLAVVALWGAGELALLVVLAGTLSVAWALFLAWRKVRRRHVFWTTPVVSTAFYALWMVVRYPGDALEAQFEHPLGMAGAFALAPQRLARAAVVPALAGRDGLAQRFVVHMRDHQHVAGHDIGRDAGDEAGSVEFRAEGQPFLDVVGVSAHGKKLSQKGARPWVRDGAPC